MQLIPCSLISTFTTPPHPTHIVRAVVSAESLSRPNVWTAYAATPAVEAAVLALEGARGQLSALQVRRGVDAAIGVDLRLSGLVEAWASGVSWEQLMADCAGLDDGDVARLLTRTMDMLRQVGAGWLDGWVGRGPCSGDSSAPLQPSSRRACLACAAATCHPVRRSRSVTPCSRRYGELLGREYMPWIASPSMTWWRDGDLVG